MFVMPLHPLAQQAAKAFDVAGPLYTAFLVHDVSVEPGDYPFAIYEWRYRGVREDVVLQPICGHGELTDKFLSLLESGESVDLSSEDLPGQPVFDALDEEHYSRWTRAQEQHRLRTRQSVAHKRESLSRSHQARLGLLRDQLAEASDENIRRMRSSQIGSAERDYARRLQELDEAQQKADVIAQPVAFGVVRIVGESVHAE